jgi:hypothetical protein
MTKRLPFMNGEARDTRGKAFMFLEILAKFGLFRA